VNLPVLRRGLLAAAIALPIVLAPAQAQNPSAAGASPPQRGSGDAEPSGSPHVKPKSTAPGGGKAEEKSDSSYSLGLLLGTQLHNAGLGRDSVAMERVVQGLRDALSGTAKATPADQMKAQGLVMATREKLALSNREASKKFLAENAKQKGVVTTPDGLEYKIITPGSGASPKPTDNVSVNYRGTLLDGTEFDSSYKRGEPIEFRLNRVIRGWAEGLQLMKVGGKARLFIPSELAYAENPPPGSEIGPDSTLIFDVELLDITPAPAPAGGGIPKGAAPKGAIPK